MITSEALAKATLPITVHELEYLYIETFRLLQQDRKGNHYLYRSNEQFRAMLIPS